jgi:hypothetical protein
MKNIEEKFSTVDTGEETLLGKMKIQNKIKMAMAIIVL